MNTSHSAPIFIIDDDKSTVAMITSCLAVNGFTNLHGFNGPVDAVCALEHTQPDLIITGINMPDASCSFLAKLVKHKSSDQFRSVQVIVIATDPSPIVVEVVKKAGAVAVLLKPVQPAEMIHCVAEALEGLRRIDQGQQSGTASILKIKEQESAILIGQEIELREVFGRPSASS